MHLPRSIPWVFYEVFIKRAGLAALVLMAGALTGARAETPDSLDQQVRGRTDAVLGGLVSEGRSSFATAAFVRQGEQVFASAFGVENPVARPPFSISSTQVDLNSLRKLFIAVAIAQLIDRHRIASVDDPVNRYLKHFRLPKAYGREITIRELATHSAGLQEAAFGAGSLEADPAEFFRQRFPGYFENAGLFSSYDNYGPSLLAYLVGEVTGEPFTRYVEESILDPLGMTDTYLSASQQPLTHRVMAFEPKFPLKTEPPPPLAPTDAALLDGVSVSTTADISKFMIALLGPTDPHGVITQPVRDLMFRVLQANGDAGSAHGLLFDALRTAASTVFVHGGKGPGISCMMALDGTRRAGLFYCYGDVRKRLDRDPAVFPPPYEQITAQMLEPLVACAPDAQCTHYPAAAWKDDWRRYAGFYIAFARHRQGISRLRSLLHVPYVRIQRAGDTLSLDGIDGFVEIAPGVFGKPGYLETLSFIKDPGSGKTVLSVSDRPSVYERPDLMSDPRFLPRLLAILVVIALSGGLFAVLPGYGIRGEVRVAAAIYAAVVACGVGALFGLSAFGRRYFEGIAWPLDIVRVCAFLTIPACAALLAITYRVHRDTRSDAARWPRLHLNAVCISSLMMVVVLVAIDLIGFSRIT